MNKDYQKITVPIKGMHCKSCEILIEDELSEIKGAKKIRADWRGSKVDIKYEGQEPDAASIEAAIKRAGYEVGTSAPVGFFSHEAKEYLDLGWALVFLVGAYLIWKGLGLSRISINTSSGLTLPLILLVGLTAGFSTCMALAGGLILGVSARYSEMHPEATVAKKFQPHLFFNSGRILSYTVLGGLLGVLGSAFQMSSLVLGIITIVVGLIMLIMGVQLIKIFPWADNMRFTLPKSISRALGLKEKQKTYSHTNAFILGALTFFLPCGFTQAMQVYAISTGNFFSGALIMGAFALGTMPGMISIGGISSAVKGNLADRFFKFAGLAVIAFAFFNFSNGLNLTGWSLPHWQISDNSAATVAAAIDPNVTIENGVQVVRMTESATGYSPNSFTIQKGLPVKWIIDAKDQYSCASTILLPGFNIRKSLTTGENTIEFTPTATGSLRFSCSMGMYTGVFNVVEGGGQANAGAANNLIATADAAGSNSASPSDTCGAASGGGGCGCGGGKKPYVPSDGAVTTGSGGIAAQVAAPAPTGTADTQNITSTYTFNNDIVPNTFHVKVGVPVHYTINVKEDGRGCMSTIGIQTLYNNYVPLQARTPIVMDFTPQTPGTYLITCAMGVPRGKIIVE